MKTVGALGGKAFWRDPEGKMKQENGFDAAASEHLRDGAVIFDVVPQLAASCVFNDHIHVSAAVNRLVHAKKITNN